MKAIDNLKVLEKLESVRSESSHTKHVSIKHPALSMHESMNDSCDDVSEENNSDIEKSEESDLG